MDATSIYLLPILIPVKQNYIIEKYTFKKSKPCLESNKRVLALLFLPKIRISAVLTKIRIFPYFKVAENIPL